MSIRIEYPVWFILLCLLLGAAVAVTLYFRNKRDDLPAWLVRLLAVMRFVTVSLISFLLLSPLIRSVTRTYEKPVVIVALDNSQSLRMVRDSAYYMTDYQKNLQRLITDLNRDYDTRVYTLGDKMNRVEQVTGPLLTLTDKRTDLSSLFEEVEAGYSNRNLGAIILASDGIYNSGLNPLYSSQRISAPLYAIALGDTSIQRDVILSRVNYNRLAYLGNTFPLEMIVAAHRYKGERSRLTVSRGDSVLFAKNIDFTSDQFTETVSAEIKATRTGLIRYRVSLSPLDGEISYGNNTTDIFIEVLDSRQKILILYHSPHPDISAIKSAIQTNYNYEVEDMDMNSFTGEVSGYNLIILHQVPSIGQGQSVLLAKIKNSSVPLLVIIGGKTDHRALGRLDLGLTLIPVQQTVNDAIPSFNEDFILFQLDEQTRAQLESFPPLTSPFGEYRMHPTASFMLYQQIGKVVSNLPLIVFTETLDRKAGFITGEGVWKWRLQNFASLENHEAFNQTMLKMIQYLAVKEQKGFFNVIARSFYAENEPVEIEAEVYNKSYELINEPDVEITIENEAGTRFPFLFGRKGKSYYLLAGSYPPGNYTYRAKAAVGGEIYEKSGQFSVEAVNIELVHTRADHDILYNLTKRHDGAMVFPDQMDQLTGMLKERGDITTVVYARKSFNEFNNIIWILLAIIALLSTEWFLRKYKGAY